MHELQDNNQSVVKIQDCCHENNGNLKGMYKSCGKHLHELQNICLMNCSSPDNPKEVDYGFYENLTLLNVGRYKKPSHTNTKQGVK